MAEVHASEAAGEQVGCEARPTSRQACDRPDSVGALVALHDSLAELGIRLLVSRTFAMKSDLERYVNSERFHIYFSSSAN